MSSDRANKALTSGLNECRSIPVDGISREIFDLMRKLLYYLILMHSFVSIKTKTLESCLTRSNAHPTAQFPTRAERLGLGCLTSRLPRTAGKCFLGACIIFCCCELKSPAFERQTWGTSRKDSHLRVLKKLKAVDSSTIVWWQDCPVFRSFDSTL